MSDTDSTPFPPVDAITPAVPEFARKTCSPDSKPPRWHVAARAFVEPKVHPLENGAFVVERDGKFVKYAPNPDGQIARVRATRKAKG